VDQSIPLRSMDGPDSHDYVLSELIQLLLKIKAKVILLLITRRIRDWSNVNKGWFFYWHYYSYWL